MGVDGAGGQDKPAPWASVFRWVEPKRSPVRPVGYPPGRRVKGHIDVGRLVRAGMPPALVGGYLHANWTDEEAMAWGRHGIPAPDAKMWRLIGLSPGEARALQENGADPVAVVAEWWRSGIPLAEVADWLGAGMTAAEALEQRAAGVTLAQAAALRALRRGA